MSRRFLGSNSNISKLSLPKSFWHIGVLMAFLVNVNTVCQWNLPTHLSKNFVKYFINSNCIFSTIFVKFVFQCCLSIIILSVFCQYYLSTKIRLTCKIMSRQLLGWDSNILKLCLPKPFWHIGVLMAFQVNVDPKWWHFLQSLRLRLFWEFSQQILLLLEMGVQAFYSKTPQY